MAVCLSQATATSGTLEEAQLPTKEETRTKRKALLVNFNYYLLSENVKCEGVVLLFRGGKKSCDRAGRSGTGKSALVNGFRHRQPVERQKVAGGFAAGYYWKTLISQAIRSKWRGC